MNKVILTGRLTRDPEARTTPSGVPVCTFTLAVDRRFARKEEDNGQPTADFVPIVAWRKTAEVCRDNLVKGRKISIEGKLQIRNYEAQDGTKRYVTEVVADNVEFLDSRNSSAAGDIPRDFSAQSNPVSASPQVSAFGGDLPDEEIPF